MEEEYVDPKILNTEEFIRRAKLKHGDRYDYSKSQYLRSKIKITISCKKHGQFSQNPADHIQGHGCKKCRKDETKGWSIDQDSFLKKHYKSEGAYWCADELNRTEHSIRGRAATIGLSKEQRVINENIPHSLWSAVLARVKEKGYDMDITPDYIWELYKLQNGKCALTGWDIRFDKRENGSLERDNISVDRIDSRIGYMKGNIQLTDKLVNRTKLNCSEEFFYSICRDVVKRRPDLNPRKIDWVESIFNDTEMPIKVDLVPEEGKRILKN